ncbi:MAG: hemerythrin domain-containing protein [Comamonadaceae bacterium]|nr:hemerythrin domain-containing protein [Comamonadaceae bacterium]
MVTGIGAAPSSTKFRRETEAHFCAEEDVLFPNFERRTGMSSGPTRMMRMEHMQMRGLLDQLAAAQAGRDTGAFCGAADTLLIMMQQHNLKEENILYPMCDQALAGDAEVASAIARALDAAA